MNIYLFFKSYLKKKIFLKNGSVKKISKITIVLFYFKVYFYILYITVFFKINKRKSLVNKYKYKGIIS